MPKYLFRVHDMDMLDDEDEVELPDFATARREALRYAGALLPDIKDDIWQGRTWRLEVRDAERILFTLSLYAEVASPP